MDALAKLRSIADYQFFRGAGEILIPDGAEIQFSKRTKRPRYVLVDGKLVATLRWKDGYLALTIFGARLLARRTPSPKLRAIVRSDALKKVVERKQVLCLDIVAADPSLRPGSEVIVVDEDDNVLGVGKALLSGHEMVEKTRCLAVKIRKVVKDAV